MTTKSEIDKQVEAAYEYRGHVTIKFKDGKTLEGFIFNRQLQNTAFKGDPFIELYPKGANDRQKYLIKDIESIALTGEDCAAPPPPKK